MPSFHTRRKKKTRIGCLYGVGVGPGDPELLTLKAFKILTRVPVVFVPKKARESRSLARSIINHLMPESEQEVVELVFPMLRDKEQLREHWQQAADIIWQYLSVGNDCAFINVGDPLLYGTFIHVIELLRKGHEEVPVEVVPGISSINAASSRGMVPLAIDDENVAIISSTTDYDFIREVLERFSTVVFMKVNKNFDRILDIIEELNLTDKCLYVKRCTTADEEVIREINQLKGQKLDYFSLMIVRTEHGN